MCVSHQNDSGFFCKPLCTSNADCDKFTEFDLECVDVRVRRKVCNDTPSLLDHK